MIRAPIDGIDILIGCRRMALDHLVAVGHRQIVLVTQRMARKNGIFPVIVRVLDGVIPVVFRIAVDIIL